MNNFTERTLTGIALVGVLAGAYFLLPAYVLTIILFGALGFILFVEWPKMGIAALTLWYPILPFALLIILNQLTEYRFLVPLVFAMAMVFDVGSYLVGSLIGRHKIAPLISPKKTWEGLIGGLVLSLPLAFLPPLSAVTEQHPRLVIIFILFTDFFALGGDLFVSLLKRRACVKDCSNVLPGHGGLLDRFDSILFVTLVVFALRKYLL